MYIFGYLILSGLFNRIIKNLNVWIVLGLSFALGNFAFVSFLFVTAITDSLNCINPVSFAILALISCILLFVLRIKRRIPLISVGVTEVVISIIFLLFFATLVKHAAFSYLLDWDAVASWFLKAKSFFYAKGFWDNVFFNTKDMFNYTNKTYPVGIPLLVAGLYRVINTTNDQTAQLYMFLFYLNLVFVTFGFARKVFANIHAITLLLIVLNFFMIPNFIMYAHNGYVDVPFGFALAVSIICLIFFLEKWREKEAITWWQIAVLTSSFAATIKNEGFVFFIIINTVMIPFLVRIRIQKKFLTIIMTICVACIPHVIWKYYTLRMQFPFYLDNTRLFVNLFSRVQLIGFQYMDEIINTSKYSITLLPFLIIVCIVAAILAVHKKFLALLPLLVVGIQFASYTYVYLVTPVPLELQLKSSLGRLLIHILPMLIIIVIYQSKVVLTFFTKKSKEIFYTTRK